MTDLISRLGHHLVELAGDLPGQHVLGDLRVTHLLRAGRVAEDLDHGPLALAGPLPVQVGPVDLLARPLGRRAGVETGSVVVALEVRARLVRLAPQV